MIVEGEGISCCKIVATRGLPKPKKEDREGPWRGVVNEQGGHKSTKKKEPPLETAIKSMTLRPGRRSNLREQARE